MTETSPEVRLRSLKHLASYKHAKRQWYQGISKFK